MENPFVPAYNELTDDQKNKIAEIKDAALVLYESIELVHGADPRCIALAKTKLEEAIMWAVKGITNPKEDIIQKIARNSKF